MRYSTERSWRILAGRDQADDAFVCHRGMPNMPVVGGHISITPSCPFSVDASVSKGVGPPGRRVIYHNT